ncbi:unnamed protein product [Brassica oleracea var. botrytis]
MLRRRRITDLLGQTLQSRDFKNCCPHIVIDVSMSLNKQRSSRTGQWGQKQSEGVFN